MSGGDHNRQTGQQGSGHRPDAQRQEPPVASRGSLTIVIVIWR